MNYLKEICEVKGCENRAVGVFQLKSSHPWYKKFEKPFQCLCKEHAVEANKLEHITSFVKADIFQRAFIFGLSLESKPFCLDSMNAAYAGELNKKYLDDSTLDVDDKDYDANVDLDTMSPEEIEFIDIYDKLFADIQLEKPGFIERLYTKFVSWRNKDKYVKIVTKAWSLGIQVPPLSLYAQVQYLKALQKTSYTILPTPYSRTFESELDEDLANFS